MTSYKVQKIFGKELYASGDSIRRRGNRSLSQKDSVLKRVRWERETRRGNDAQVVLDLKFERQVVSVGSSCSYSSSDIDEIRNLWIEYVFEHHQQ
ncbi:hypothetical protein OROMI_018410 [Orobanche minor]